MTSFYMPVKTNLSLHLKIKKSVFESNSFLLDIEPTLIEYAAFFGSIQIFRYLRYNDVALSDVTLPPSINEIKKFAFYECFSLRQIQLPQPLAVLGDDVFNSCSKLSEIVIPSSVAQIGYDCSAKCSSLKI